MRSPLALPRRIQHCVLALGVCLLVLSSACSRQTNSGPNTLVVSGNIEVVDAQLGFKVSGRVSERLVAEGDKVKQGQLVARLDDSEQKALLAQRKAELAAATAALAELEAGSRPQEIASAEASLKSTQAERDRSRLEFLRQKELREKNAIAIRDFEVAEASLKVAEAHVVEADERAKLVREGPRIESIHQARARVQQAQAASALAETQLENTQLFSPLTGVVLSHNIEAGEFVSPGTPVVTVADTVHLWVRAYVNQTDLSRVKLGQKATVKIDSTPAKSFEGTLGFIASDAEFTPKTVQTPTERVKLVFRIKVYVNNPQGELKPGMPADVLFP